MRLLRPPDLEPSPPPPRRGAGLRHVLAGAVLVTALAASTLIVSDIVGSRVTSTPDTVTPAVRVADAVAPFSAACGGTPDVCARRVRAQVRQVRIVTPPLDSAIAAPAPAAPAAAPSVSPSSPAPSVPDQVKRSAER